MDKSDIRLKAMEIIAYDGFSEFTLSKLASELNAAKASLFYYYKSKDEIVSDIFISGHKALMSKGFSIDLSLPLNEIIEKAYINWDRIFSDNYIALFLRIVFSLHFVNEEAKDEYNALCLMLQSQATVIISGIKSIKESNKSIISTLFSSFLIYNLEKYIEGEEVDFKKNLEDFVFLFS